MSSPVSYAKAIRPLFTQMDIEHMNPYDVHLDQYPWMSDAAAGSIGSCMNFNDHANARSVYAFLTGDCQPQMPLGGPFWHPDKLEMYRRWMEDGFQP